MKILYYISKGKMLLIPGPSSFFYIIFYAFLPKKIF